MEVRQAALKCLIKILEHHEFYDETLGFYADKVDNPSDLTNTVAGAIKFKGILDYFIDQISSKKVKRLSPVVRNLLRLGIFELEYLKRPEYAVVNSYVNMCRTSDKKSAGFVNAILRNFLRKRPEIKINEDLSHPEWLVKRWVKAYGKEETAKIIEYNNKPPKITLRSKDGEVMTLESGGKVVDVPGFSEGKWVVQGRSSMLVSEVLDPQPGEKILDLCAAPGTKTMHIASLMGDKGKIVAVDVSPKRLEKVKDNCKRLGITSVEVIAADAATLKLDEKFDRILVDAPCSNTGVLNKRPDARWNRKPEDIANLADLQFKILDNAVNMLKEGGVIVYSTCSIEPEEDQEVIDRFLVENGGFEVEMSRLILQSRDDMDGFFIAKLRQSRSETSHQ